MARERYDAVVIGSSAGGSTALLNILPELPAGYSLPIIIVQHLHPLQSYPAITYLCRKCALIAREAEDKEAIRPGFAYFAPANYHLLVEEERSFALSIDGKVNFTRPSIDVLFESAAHVYGKHLIGVILSGGNKDGAAGLNMIKQRGGLVIVQDPNTAESPFMPAAALESTAVDMKASPAEIGKLLLAVEHGRRGK
jgi:two-component system chemotaxis response regulator CheB